MSFFQKRSFFTVSINSGRFFYYYKLFILKKQIYCHELLAAKNVSSKLKKKCILSEITD